MIVRVPEAVLAVAVGAITARLLAVGAHIASTWITVRDAVLTICLVAKLAAVRIAIAAKLS